MAIKQPIQGKIEEINVRGPFTHGNYGDYMVHEYKVNGQTFNKAVNKKKPVDAQVGENVKILYSTAQGRNGEFNKVILIQKI